MTYICPVCDTPLHLHQSAKGYYCDNKHHYDLAKEGYLNLLVVQHKNSKQPGDSRQMMRARRNFLEAGYYQPMAEAVARQVMQQLADKEQPALLDLGCGEGYYSRQIAAHLADQGNPTELRQHGLDIAKNAILAAAKKQPGAQFVVASSDKVPLASANFDMLLKIYAPANDNELRRLVKAGGYLLTVTPGPRHLWQLREFIYRKVKEHPVEAEVPEGFDKISDERLQFEITPSSEERMALLQMTPFAWRANDKIRNTIANAGELAIETDFILTLSQRTGE